MFDIKGTLFTGKCFIDLPSVPSTNVYAGNLLEKNSQKNNLESTITEGTIISTFDQTRGKGAHQNKWLSEPGKNLSFSIILFPAFLKAQQQFHLNITICVGIIDFFLEHFNKSFKIKWPNDIYFHNYKLGGILIENILIGSAIKSAVTGIGLNINQTVFSTSLPNPTSLKLITGKTFNLYDLIEELAICIERRYLQLRNQQYHRLKMAYLNQLYQINQTAVYKFRGKEVPGKIIGINDDGKLLIQFKNETIAFGFKEVEFIL